MRRVEVAGPVENEGRALDAREHGPDVDHRVHEDEVAGARGAEARPAAPTEPAGHRGIGGRSDRRQVEVHAPARLERLGVALAGLARGRPRVVVVRVAALRVDAVEDEGPSALRVRGREEDAHRPALRVPEEHRRSEPTASMTARTSSIRVSRSGSPTAGRRARFPACRSGSGARTSRAARRAARCPDAPSRSRGARRTRARGRGRSARRP